MQSPQSTHATVFLADGSLKYNGRILDGLAGFSMRLEPLSGLSDLYGLESALELPALASGGKGVHLNNKTVEKDESAGD